MIVDFLDNSIGTLPGVPKTIFQDTDDSNRCWDDRLTSILIILRTETKDIIGRQQNYQDCYLRQV